MADHFVGQLIQDLKHFDIYDQTADYITNRIPLIVRRLSLTDSKSDRKRDSCHYQIST